MPSPKYELLPPFFETVLKVKIPAAGTSGKFISDMGLIVHETEEISLPEISKLLPSGIDAISGVLREGNDAEYFANVFTDANESGKWLLVAIENDVTHVMLGYLKEISENGVLSQNGKEIPLRETTRVIVAVGNETLEKKITYPYFMEMFGPIARI
jgi:hypothetical protein